MVLHLVRHGVPKLDLAVLPAQWQLDPKHVHLIRELGMSGVLPSDAHWISSDSPKAVETARILRGSLPDVILPELCEQHRPAGWVDAYAVRVHRSMTRPDEPAEEGWETADATRERVVEAVTRVLEDGHDNVVAVGHGTAWTLLVSELTGSAVDLVAWERMLLPDHCAIDNGGIVQRWGSWQER